VYMNQACTATPGHVHSGLSFEQVNALRQHLYNIQCVARNIYTEK
jgi:hypothetical protein